MENIPYLREHYNENGTFIRNNKKYFVPEPDGDVGNESITVRLIAEEISQYNKQIKLLSKIN
jgi:hypothetical protein